uniref:Uncharacterized protein n=1 Tax=Meloidogyne enterolobii TaxID=390850 RepID=A0A6V7UFY7_MELEN|nr:unnamed protein product [Meloidogyne enterolobii]
MNFVSFRVSFKNNFFVFFVSYFIKNIFSFRFRFVTCHFYTKMTKKYSIFLDNFFTILSYFSAKNRKFFSQKMKIQKIMPAALKMEEI